MSRLYLETKHLYKRLDVRNNIITIPHKNIGRSISLIMLESIVNHLKFPYELSKYAAGITLYKGVVPNLKYETLVLNKN